MKKTVAVVVAIVFVLAFAAPVFAQANMSHNAVYKMDGSIDIEKQVGHLCNTGAEMKQVIAGEGEMDKVMDVNMKRYVLTVDDKNDFVTAEDAVRNLSVISVIELCAPAKHEYDVTDYAYSTDVAAVSDGFVIEFGGVVGEGETPVEAFEDLAAQLSDEEFIEWIEFIEEEYDVVFNTPEFQEAILNWFVTASQEVFAHPAKQGVGWGKFKSVDGEVLSTTAGYHLLGWEDKYASDDGVFGSKTEMLAAYMGMSPELFLATYSAAEIAEIEALLGAHGGYSHWEVDALTDQIWAAHVQADPGFSGNLHQNFEAAYGPYEGDFATSGPAYGYGEDEEDYEIYNTAFGYRVDDDGYWVVVTGDDYVGNYFTIDQMARTSQGAVQRYIDISSPFSHAYLYEDMTVVGMVEVEESFAMNNLAPGEEAVPDWWDLF